MTSERCTFRYVITGLSLGNSHFTKGVVTRLLATLIARYDRVFVIVVDKPAMFNMLAAGVDEKRATKKIAIESRRLVRFARAVESDRITLLDWTDDVEKAPAFKRALDILSKAVDGTFAKHVHETTVLRLGKAAESKEAVALASQYLLAELAMLSSLHRVHLADAKDFSLDCVYHREWPVLDMFLGGKYAEFKDVAEVATPMRFVRVDEK